MNLEIKTQEKGKIIEIESRKMIRSKERDKYPFPKAKIGDLLHFTIRYEFFPSIPKYEFIIRIFKHSLKTGRINPKKGIIEIMNYLFEDYSYWLGDFYNNSKSIKIITNTSKYQRIESNMKNFIIIQKNQSKLLQILQNIGELKAT